MQICHKKPPMPQLFHTSLSLCQHTQVFRSHSSRSTCQSFINLVLDQVPRNPVNTWTARIQEAIATWLWDSCTWQWIIRHEFADLWFVGDTLVLIQLNNWGRVWKAGAVWDPRPLSLQELTSKFQLLLLTSHHPKSRIYSCTQSTALSWNEVALCTVVASEVPGYIKTINTQNNTSSCLLGQKGSSVILAYINSTYQAGKKIILLQVCCLHVYIMLLNNIWPSKGDRKHLSWLPMRLQP